jgi:hypothetical protein
MKPASLKARRMLSSRAADFFEHGNIPWPVDGLQVSTLPLLQIFIEKSKALLNSSNFQSSIDKSNHVLDLPQTESLHPPRTPDQPESSKS